MTKVETAFKEYIKRKRKDGFVYSHQFGCPNIDRGLPIDVCNCDCLEFGIFRNGYQAAEKRYKQ